MLNQSGNGHIFSNHLLVPLQSRPEVNHATELVWPSVYLFICLFLLAYIKAGSFSRVVRIIQSTFSKQILQQLEREELNASKIHSVGLTVFFLLNLAFLTYKINSLHDLVLHGTDSLLQYLFFVILILFLFACKQLSLRMLALITDRRRLVTDVRTSATLLNQTFGLLIFPFLVFSEFTNWNPRYFLGSALVILTFSLFLKWYRGLMMSLVEERIGLLQIFSYFCGLEVLPLLTVVKFVVETL